MLVESSYQRQRRPFPTRLHRHIPPIPSFTMILLGCGKVQKQIHTPPAFSILAVLVAWGDIIIWSFQVSIEYRVDFLQG